MEEQYGKMRGSTMRIIMDAAIRERTSLWAVLLPRVVPQFKDGDMLKRVEAGWLADWLARKGRDDLELGDVQTVQIPRDCARPSRSRNPHTSSQGDQGPCVALLREPASSRQRP